MATMLMPPCAKGFQHGLQLVLRHGEIAVHDALSSVPANAAQVFTPISLPLASAGHLRRAADDDFEHAVFAAFVPRMSSIVLPAMEFCSGQRRAAERFAGCGFAARISFLCRQRLFHARRGQFLSVPRRRCA